MNLFKESVEYNLSFLLPTLGIHPVSGAAFSLARYKIKLSFFVELNRLLLNFHQRNSVKLWKGFQLLAGDGSTVSLPPSRQIKQYFGVYSEKGGKIKSCMARVFALYDVYSNIILSSALSGMEVSEKVMLKNCIGELEGNKQLIILDRGFGYFNICNELIRQKKAFCIRLSTAQSFFAKAALANPLNDFITQWVPSEAEKKTCSELGNDYGSIKVRVSKIRLNTGEIELLVSSLFDLKAIKLTDMAELYGFRWGIEEAFKKLKPKMKLEQFGSRKPDGIFQEFQAHVFMMNLISLMGEQAQIEITKKYSTRKLTYKYNWQNAFRTIRRQIIQIIGLDNSEKVFDKIIESIKASIIPIKPGRSFKRIVYKRRKNRLHQTYK